MDREFFIVCPLGAEEDAFRELNEVIPFLVDTQGWPYTSGLGNLKIVKGGIEFTADIAVGLQLNYWLKIPVRILMRVMHFKSRDRRDFLETLEKAPWQEWLSGPPESVKAESAASGVWNESWIQDEVSNLLKKKIKTQGSGSTIYLRGLENRWTVSIDLSGEPLFKRGWAKNKERAPLRENLAVLGLWDLIQADTDQLHHVTLADPFLGSGTILSEAFHLFDLNTERSFSFEKEPFCPKLLRDKKIITNYRARKGQTFQSYFGSEIDKKTFSTAEKNLEFIDGKKLHFGSFEENTPAGRTWILTNPPYEKRVRIKGGVSSEDWLQEVIARWAPERITFYFPKDRIKELSWPQNYKILSKRAISHGGLLVQLTTLGKG